MTCIVLKAETVYQVFNAKGHVKTFWYLALAKEFIADTEYLYGKCWVCNLLVYSRIETEAEALVSRALSKLTREEQEALGVWR